ncbi:signal transduction histidine kinase [Opitutaceae bacterium TAV1]|nr:signal transduction histidine kinase [Opitutaceae bacterium TAV1]
MTTARRRTLCYWLLLLVPALCVAAGALWLVTREQARINERARATLDARRAAIASRTALIAENLALLFTDAQTGLASLLAEAPADPDAGYLDRWQQGAPLLRLVFRASPDGRILHPAPASSARQTATTALQAWLASSSPSAPRATASRGFVAPPEPAAATPVPGADMFSLDLPKEKTTVPVREADQRLSKQVYANVAQVQRARSALLTEANSNLASDAMVAAAAPTPPAASAGMDAGSASLRFDETPSLTTSASLSPTDADTTADASARAEPAPSAPAAVAYAPEKPSGRHNRQAAELRSAPPPAPASAAAAPAALPAYPVTWTSRNASDGLHLYAWRQLPAGDWLGLEVDLVQLAARLGDALPAELSADEAYQLRATDAAPARHYAGATSATQPVATASIAPDLLPGWNVAGLVALPANGSLSPGSGFLTLGGLLVAILLAAILSGGALLAREARLRDAEATQKTSFVANVSHELKTPLTTIRLYAELLEQGRVRDDARRTDYLRTIGRETQRLARLVNNVLDFSRLEQGRKNYRLAPLDLTEAVAALLDAHAPRLADAGLALHRVLPSAPLTVTTDRDALEQILLNLLDNACKYAAGGHELTVDLTAVTDGVELRVHDRGPGIPPAHRARVFEKFHRVDDTLTAAQAGAGLGLSIAQQLARGLGGDLRHEDRPGGGSTFILRLPAIPPPQTGN